MNLLIELHFPFTTNLKAVFLGGRGYIHRALPQQVSSDAKLAHL